MLFIMIYFVLRVKFVQKNVQIFVDEKEPLNLIFPQDWENPSIISETHLPGGVTILLVEDDQMVCEKSR